MAFYDDVHSTKKYRLGTRKRDVAGNEYIYLTGVGSTAAGSWVTYDELYVTTLMDTDVAASVIAPAAVAKAAVDATTEYGWYLIWGSGSAAAATVAADAKVFASATAGSCDDTGTAGQQIVGAVWRSADASSLATVQLNYPMVGINVA
jgi:hypothetical protein